MSDIGSITNWICQLKQGEREALQKLWERYYHRLISLARRELQALPVLAAADEDDVVNSAFFSFFRAAEAGRFPQLDDRHDLWQILVMLTRRKAIDLKQYETSGKRNTFKVSRNFTVPENDSDFKTDDFIGHISKEPDPAFAAEIAEQCCLLLEKLMDSQLRYIAVRKMEGCTNLEIADHLDLAQSTIERRLQVIRKCWQEDLPPQ